MLPQKPTPDKSKDELQRRLQESLKTKRPRWFRFALGGALTAVAAMALLTWLLSPKGDPPPLIVVAFDDLQPGSGEATLQGRLDAPADQPSVLSGKDMVFVDGETIPGQQAKEVSARTGRHGEVSCRWTFAADTSEGNFILRRIADKFRPGLEDRGRIFLLPKATGLCMVQIDETLTHAKDQSWRNENIHDIVPVPGAAETLREAHQQGYEIVYLALAADRPTLYQKMRGWVRHRTAEGSAPFPLGVVLGRFTLPEAEQDSKTWQKTAARLAHLFEGRHVAVAGTIDVAQQFHAAGCRTLYLGAGDDLPAAVERVPGWKEVRHALEK
jgi:hypothetical protein